PPPPRAAPWYAVHEIGYPDPPTFTETFARASEWLDGVAATPGIPYEQGVIGGVSQGAVMTCALGLGAGRPRPAGMIALSGFVPSVQGFSIALTPPLPRVAIGHGALDPVISVEWSRRAYDALRDAGADVVFSESPTLAHAIDPRSFRELPGWLAETLVGSRS